MEKVKDVEGYKIFKKGSGRFAVKDAKTGKYVNAEKKVEVLLAQGLIKKMTPKKKEEAAPAAE